MSVLVDRRTREWRRRAQLVKLFTNELGGPSLLTAAQAVKVDTAAELAVIAELARASFMAGNGVTADDVVRTSRAASLAEKQLGIDSRKAKTKRTLADVLRQHEGEREA